MKLLKLAALLGCMTVAGNAATITVTQGFGAQGLLVTSDGVTPVPFFWSVGNWASDTWTQFGDVVEDTDKVNGSVTAGEPASLNNQVIHLWVGLGATGTAADLNTPWVILRMNNDMAFPPDVAVAGATVFNAAIGNNLTQVAASGAEWTPTATGGGIVLVPEPSAALLGLIGLLGFIRRRR